jgi:hypothetical protein
MSFMTLLVGMIGSDGIIFAADELMVREAQHGTEYDDRVFIQKLQHSKDYGVVVAGVGDQTTRRVEEAFLSALHEGRFDFRNIQRALAAITRDALKAVRTKAELDYPDAEHREAFLNVHLPRALLIAFYGGQLHERQLWSVFIADTPAVVQITGCRVNGGLGNLCRFFADYYRPGKPVASLANLAAYTVFAASRFDSMMIAGVQMAVIDETGFRLLSDTDKAALRKGYDELDCILQERLLPS